MRTSPRPSFGSAVRSRRSRRDAEGFTLVEMVVALGIVTVVLLAALSALISVMQSQRFAEASDRAIQLANSRIEQVRQLDWANTGFERLAYDHDLTEMDGEHKYFKTGVDQVCAENLAPCPVDKMEETIIVAENGLTSDDGSVPDPLQPVETDTTTHTNDFTIHTYITWAYPQGENKTSTTNADGDVFAFKRVRVVVWWKLGNTTHHVTDQTLIAPTVTEVVPPEADGPAGSAPVGGANCPSGVAMVRNGGSLEVSWDAVSGASDYYVLRNGLQVARVADTGQPTYTTAVTAPTVLSYFTVMAKDSTGMSAGCTGYEYTPPPPIPTCPTNVDVSVSWDPVITWQPGTIRGDTYTVTNLSTGAAHTVPHDLAATNYGWTITPKPTVATSYRVTANGVSGTSTGCGTKTWTPPVPKPTACPYVYAYSAYSYVRFRPYAVSNTTRYHYYRDGVLLHTATSPYQYYYDRYPGRGYHTYWVNPANDGGELDCSSSNARKIYRYR